MELLLVPLLELLPPAEVPEPSDRGGWQWPRLQMAVPTQSALVVQVPLLVGDEEHATSPKERPIRTLKARVARRMVDPLGMAAHYA